METASSAHSTSCFARLKESCLCSTTTRNLAKLVTLSFSLPFSLYLIRVNPLRGAAVGLTLFLLLNNAYSTFSDMPPREWKHLISGAGFCTGLMAVAFTIHNIGSPIVAGIAIMGSCWIAYSDSLWQRCSALHNWCFPAQYNRLPPNDGQVTSV